MNQRVTDHGYNLPDLYHQVIHSVYVYVSEVNWENYYKYNLMPFSYIRRGSNSTEQWRTCKKINFYLYQLAISKPFFIGWLLKWISMLKVLAQIIWNIIIAMMIFHQ